MFLFTCFISFFLQRLYKWSQIDFNFQREGRRLKILIIEIICIGVLNVIYLSALSSMSHPASSMAGGLVLAMGALWVVVAAARGAAGEVVVGALVSILLVPVVGLVVVAAVLLLLLVVVGAALLLLLVAVGAAKLLLLVAVGAALLLLLVVVGAALLLLLVVVGRAAADCSQNIVSKAFYQIRKPFCASDKDDTPIFNRQVTKDSTQQLGHHACFTCEMNGRSLHACCTYMYVACTSSYSFLMLVQYNMPSRTFGW